MKRNINKIIDLTLNEDILKEFLGEYEITKDWNIKTKSWRTLKVPLYDLGLRKAIIFKNETTLQKILKIIPCLSLNGSNKWRLPTTKEMRYIFRNVEANTFIYYTTCWTCDNNIPIDEFGNSRVVVYNPSLSFGDKIDDFPAMGVGKIMRKIVLVR